MRTEAEVRALLNYIVTEEEGGIDAFMDAKSRPQEHICLYCRYLRLLHWVLGNIKTPYIDNAMQPIGLYTVSNVPDEVTRTEKARGEAR